MTPDERKFLIKRALLRALEDCGSYAVTVVALLESATIKIDHLRPTVAEIDAQFRAINTERLCVSLPSDRGEKCKLTDAGRLWLAENP